MKISKFPFLDSFRGFFAFTVVIGHLQYVAKEGPWGIVDWLHTNIGVFGFFVLSSFLLTYRLFSEFTLIVSATDKTLMNKLKFLTCSIIKFAIRRFTRIQPLFISLVIITRYGPSFTNNIISGLSDNWLHMLLAIDTGQNITWTIHVEMVYYILIPLICVFALFCGKKYKFVPPILLFVFAIYFDVHWTVERYFKYPGQLYCKHGHICSIAYFKFTSWASAFLAGSVCALIYYWFEKTAQSVLELNITHCRQQQHIFDVIVSPSIRNILNISCYVLSIAFIIIFSERWALLSLLNLDPTKIYNYPGYHWSLVLFFALISRGSFTETFNNRFWNQAGKVSYGIYLTHWTCLYNVKNVMKPLFFNGFEGFIAYVFVVMVVSTITYYLIEYPGMWIGSKLCQFVDKIFETNK